MSKLTLNKAIKHCLETVEQLEECANTPYKCGDSELQDNACRECAADHRQLAEWLMEYKDLKAEQNDQYVFIHELMSELKEAKRLLKVAVEDFQTIDKLLIDTMDSSCAMFNHMANNCPNCPMNALDTEGKCKWRYSDEALKLIES